VTDFPDEIVGGFIAEPRLQHITDAEALVLSSEEAPRALQLSPESHEAFLSVFNVFHSGSQFFTFHFSLFTFHFP
jgi:hypothetical protein